MSVRESFSNCRAWMNVSAVKATFDVEYAVDGQPKEKNKNFSKPEDYCIVNNLYLDVFRRAHLRDIL